MALQQEVLAVLTNVGVQLKNDLWSPSDLEVLKQRAMDLVGLEVKALEATEPSKREQYRLAATLAVQHVCLRALTRMSIGENTVRDALERLLSQVLVPALAKLLPSLFRG